MLEKFDGDWMAMFSNTSERVPPKNAEFTPPSDVPKIVRPSG